jgi:hypothetical protein
MKKQHLSIVVATVAIAVAGVILFHALTSRGPDAAPEPAKRAPARQSGGGNARTPKAPKQALRVEDLPAEIVAAAKKAGPTATIEVTQADANRGQYRLRLTSGERTATARLRLANGEVTGNLNETMPVGELPPVVMSAFREAFTNATIESASRRTYLGGKQDGQVVLRWDWGNNRDGEASPDGKQIRMTAEIPSSELPATVVEAVNKQFPQAAIDKKADRIVENGVTSFEFSLKPADGGKKVDVRVFPDGTIKRL